MTTTRFMVITGMILAAAASRLLPHPPNFTPVAAMALFAGATLSHKWHAFLVPLAAMVLSDVFLYSYHSQDFDQMEYLSDRAVVYACLAGTVCIGFWLRNRWTVVNVVGAALAGSVFFFVTTNFAVWLTGQGLSYPRTLGGLLACYVAAIPFFGWTVLGDLVFSAVLFGSFALLVLMVPDLVEPAPAPAEQEEYVLAEK